MCINEDLKVALVSKDTGHVLLHVVDSPALVPGGVFWGTWGWGVVGTLRCH